MGVCIQKTDTSLAIESLRWICNIFSLFPRNTSELPKKTKETN